MILIRAVIVLALVEQQDDPVRQARELVEKLRSEKIEEREEAARKLKEMGEVALPELRKAAESGDAEVVARAKQLLRVIPMAEKLPASLKRAFPNIEDRLASDDPHAWTEAFLAAATHRDVKGLQAVVRADDLDILAGPALRGTIGEEEKIAVIDAVERNYLLAVAPELFRLLRHKEHQVSSRAACALVNLDMRQVVPEILRLLDDPSQHIRHTAIGLLRDLGTREAIPGVIKRLKDSNGEIRNQAAQAIAELEAREAIPELLGALDDPEANRRGEVVEALGRVGAKEAVPKLIGLLNTGNARVRKSAVEALATLGAKEAIPAIVKALGDGESNVQQGAISALKELGAKEAMPEIMKLLEAKGKYVRSWVPYCLPELDAREEIPTLSRLLSDPDADLRTGAAWALGQMGVKESIPALVKLLSDSDDNARSNAAHALAKMGSRDSIPEIKRLLEDRVPWVRGRALQALVDLGAEESLDEALKLLGDRDEGLHREALRAIGLVGGRKEREKIVPLLEDPHPSVRIDAAATLCTWGLRDGVPVLLREGRDRRWPLPTPQGAQYIGKSFRSLNALRQPPAWKRLCQTPAPVGLEGTRKEIVERLASEVGLAVEWPASLDDPWLSGRRPSRGRSWQGTVLDQMFRILQGYRTLNKPARYEFILEGDRLRVMTYYDALRFWERWWATEEKKK